MATSAEWHEDYAKMSEASRNFSRAVKSVQEELEAVDWYNQRAQATKDKRLRNILKHNRDEEIEHAMMTLEYLRRTNKVFDKHMRTYLFSGSDIVKLEKKAKDDIVKVEKKAKADIVEVEKQAKDDIVEVVKQAEGDIVEVEMKAEE